MKIAGGTIVRIDCELRAKGGDVIESSEKSGPVDEYKHGTGRMLKGLEAILEGMGVGDETSGVIAAADAFGTAESQPKMRPPSARRPRASVRDDLVECRAGPRRSEAGRSTSPTLPDRVGREACSCVDVGSVAKLTKIVSSRAHTRTRAPAPVLAPKS